MEKENKIENTLKWANAQLGKYVQPCSTRGCKYSANTPGNNLCTTPNPGPDADDRKIGNLKDGHAVWNFYCMRFVRTAYSAPAGYAKANDMYLALKKNGEIKTDKNIPSGALVFWPWESFGHIGICVGDGNIIHTGVNPKTKEKGIRISSLADITEVMDGYNKVPNTGKSYLGWAYPPKGWL